ncbi:hypothetical protein QZH41_015324 [Actinostola sp. cb2023]|nr:hypothetical protein QZH41_015324 [Actinostola sp. cb2023]
MARLQKGCSPSPDLDPDDNDEDDKNDDAYDEKKDQESIDATKVQTTLKEQIAIPNELENKDTDSSQSTQTPEPPPLALQVKEVDKPTPQNLLKDLDESPSKPHRDEVLKFQLSAMTPQEKMDYSALIEQLGGQVFDTQYFKTACSHVVVGKPNSNFSLCPSLRNEKYLAAIAAGKWVLHKSYLEDSRQAGHFVDEESHEWGTDVPGEQPNKLAIAARRWRLKLKEQRKNSGNDLIGAFSGWRVLLCVDKLRQSGFKRLLEAGGAQVVGSRPPFNNIENVSHAFIDYNKMKPGTLDIDALYAAGIWLVKPDYIAEFLMQDPEPHPGRFLIPEAAKLNQSESNTSVQRKRKGDDLSTDEKRMRIE